MHRQATAGTISDRDMTQQVALCVARYVDLPASAMLRGFGAAKYAVLDHSRIPIALRTLGGVAKITASIWQEIAAGFVQDPERYVLFHEILDAVEVATQSQVELKR